MSKCLLQVFSGGRRRFAAESPQQMTAYTHEMPFCHRSGDGLFRIDNLSPGLLAAICQNEANHV
ncbi:MAG: hypothetical protein ABGZ23_14975 [Fuerstiella sp.]